MSSTSPNPTTGNHAVLRRDLESVQVVGQVRPYRIIIDEISGRFARVSEHLWQRLVGGEDDPALWAQADAAGWTQRRPAERKKTWSLLAIRVSLGGIDWLACRLSPISGILFSARAIMAWTTFIVVAAMIAVSRSAELTASLSSLASYLQQTHPIWIALVFVITKVCHELGHAVMCRRMGSRCGSVGILFLCGMPSPYCDVTNIWRQPSALKRAAVMLAGIYIELIIASIATIVWMSASDAAVRLTALNLMVVCGISTIVFNANPLMRYDGYFVLSDLLGSTHLRQEARAAFHSVVTRRIAGRAYNTPLKSDRRSLLLAAYHAAAKSYRLIVTCAIASLLIGFADWFQLRSVAIVFVLLIALMATVRFGRRLYDILAGKAAWQRVAYWRRGLSVGLLLMIAAVLFFAPLPRYRRAVGIVDASDAVSIYLPENGLIERVSVDYGDNVHRGDSIVTLDSQQHAIRTGRLEGQLRLATMRSNLSRRSALDGPHSANPETADHWNTLQAAEDSVKMQLASARQRMASSDVRAEIDGIVIPGKPAVELSPTGTIDSLRARQGVAGSTRNAWCRISRGGRLHAALVIDARDRPNIQIGSKVMISLSRSPDTVIESSVLSVSHIKQDDRLAVHQAAYQVLCPIPSPLSDISDDSIANASVSGNGQLLSMIGHECRGVFRLPSRSFASDLVTWLGDWLRG